MSKNQKFYRDVLELVAVVVIVSAARSSLADHYWVPTGSMEPTVAVGDRLVVDKAAYGLRVPFTTVRVFDGHAPRRGDVVVLESPVDGQVLLKRVAAIPGDTVEVSEGRITIDAEPRTVVRDGEHWTEQIGGREHALDLTPDGGPRFGPQRLGQDEYLVLGDNRGRSFDGRMFGLVRREAILGRAQGVFWRGGRPIWSPL